MSALAHENGDWLPPRILAGPHDHIVDQEAHATVTVMAPIRVATGAPITDLLGPLLLTQRNLHFGR
jgi:hypothetical protein